MAVKNLSEILENILLYEQLKLKSFEIKTTHGPTIGEQYEKIVMKGLNGILPDSSDIRVVTGFIFNDDKTPSRQIDCMIVKGNGIEDPVVKGKYYYHIHDVIAVIEVKKNLFKTEIESSFENLYSFISPDFDKSFPDMDSEQVRDFFHCFAEISGRLFNSYLEVEQSKSDLLKNVFNGFRCDYTRPLRIVFGYEGLVSEVSLREKFTEFLKGHLGENGFGPFSFPDLIICGNNCLFKLNSEPYPAHLSEDEYFFYASSSNNNINILVELLLGRLSRYFPIDYSDDTQMEPVNLLFSASIARQDDRVGWKINIIDLDANPKTVPIKWKPIYVSDKQCILFSILCKGDIDTRDTSFQSFLEGDKDIVNQMLNTKLVAMAGTKMTLLSSKLMIVMLPTGECVVGDDKFGYFSKWIEENYIHRNHHNNR